MFKKSRKRFLSEIDLDSCHVKIVDDYPSREIDMDVLYVKRSGKIVWIWVQEGGSELWDEK